MANVNILSQRYATPEMNEIWSERGRVLRERDLWIAVMKAERAFGIDIPGEDIEKFERARQEIDLDRIREIEGETRHDVKARIQAFIEVAGAGQHIHKPLTSRDATDNVEQMQIREAARLIQGKYISVARHFADKAEAYAGIVLTARTHHQPAQPTLLGRRFAMWLEELHENITRFQSNIDDYPFRGIKGPVGTQADLLQMLGSVERVSAFEQRIADHLGFSRTLSATGQVYPRSFDFRMLTDFALLSSACQNFSLGMRLMAGYELVTEGFKPGQVGSSAMPHKMNTRTSERIWSSAEVLKMYAEGASRIAGNQWEEGDVSCSLLRRVILPDASYTSDGLCEATLTVLNEMGVYPAMIERELQRYQPFLATTALLLEVQEAGIGREDAHALIKEHAKRTALDMRESGIDNNNLVDRLAMDPRLDGFSRERIQSTIDEASQTTGNALRQVRALVKRTRYLEQLFPEEARYEPQDIL